MRVVDMNGSGGDAPRAVEITQQQQPQQQQPLKQEPTQTVQEVSSETEESTASTEQQEPRSLASRDLEQLWQWNEQVPPLLQRCMHSIISEQAAKQQPDAIAVQSWDGTLTYTELEQLSTRVARCLVAKGVVVGTRVPLCFEKSMWAIVALLGVMKAGATFSLTDPSQPEARLQTIVEQTGAKLVVTSAAQSPLGHKIAQGGEVVAICREFFSTLPQEQDTVTLPSIPPSTPMYIIFTSGSTGKPKGVVISHENYTSGAIPRAEAVGYKENTRCFDFPSYAFDVSIDCMLCTLAMGGRVCVPSEEDRMNDLSGAIRESKANMVHMTPSVARVLDSDIIPSLEVLGLGGEAVGASDAANWSQYTSLVIAYGPSECTVGCTINNKVTVSTGIGWGVGGVTWIVDPEDHNRLTPVGETGELIIEGPVVGVGYLDEPEKTAEVFIENPTWLLEGQGNIPGRHGRLYKTGDLVKYENNDKGLIEFVGRKDQQVKLRGQRVELAEVEYHLQQCLPAGVKVAAEVIKSESGAASLVAFLAEDKPNPPSSENEVFVEPSEELNVAISTIDSTMGAKVPRYMVPAALITLNEMPVLVSRKIDRKKLRQIGASIPREKLSRMQTTEVDEEEPETEVEKKLQQAWIKVLGDDTKIYRQSNFFHIGGDSLRAMRLVAAARDQGLQITVADIFINPSLRDMAERTTTATETTAPDVPPFSLLGDWDVESAKKEVAELSTIDPEIVEDVYPCTPLQEALMALSAKVKEAYVAQRVVTLDSQDMADKLIAAFDVAQNDSAILRTRVVQVPGRGLMQVVVKGNLNCFYGDKLDDYLVRDRDEGMDLGRPLVRYAIINEKLESGEVSFVLTMHHALYDGWSMPVVVDRINKAYQGERLTRQADFKHFIQYLMKQKRSDSEKYWRDLLEGGTGFQFPPVPYTGYQPRADSLLEIYVPTENNVNSNATTATIIRGAWAFVASRYTNNTDMIFGETLTGRNAPIIGAEEIEGPMITTVPVRVQADHNVTVEDYLMDIREQTVSKIPHEHFGLQHIRRVSPDALEACELGTGLVLHPSTTSDPIPDPNLPPNRLVPAGDEEAAQEALKFNTYAVMLVCSIDPKGYFVMASFDSQTVAKPIMEKMLEQMKHVTQHLCAKPNALLADIPYLPSEHEAELQTIGQSPKFDKVPEGFAVTKSAFIVTSQDLNNLVPIGGYGEVILCTTDKLEVEEIQAPTWGAGHAEGTRYYKTGKLARYETDGTITFTGDASARAAKIVAPKAPRKHVSATSRRQRRLRNLWSRVLLLPEEQIGLNDSFFNLGGDSIAAMKLVSEARAESIALTVMQIFNKRSLYDMANVMVENDDAAPQVTEVAPFSLLDQDANEFVQVVVQPQLEEMWWEVLNVYPSRPLQHVAVLGTVNVPRFSTRYELMYLDSDLDTERVKRACYELVARTEMLRTVFIEHHGKSYSVVLKDLKAPFIEYKIDGDVESFAKKVCELDVMTKMPYGSSFIKWYLIKNEKESCLVFRISHAQYDEICLPIILRQIPALYQYQPIKDSIPFSSYVGHIHAKTIPNSIGYWKDLLQGSAMTILRPDIPVERSNHFAIEKSLSIVNRPREITQASFPTAAWAYCLAKHLGLRDVTFGEVVSGRNIDYPNADNVVGPTWQYIPVRVKFDDPNWTGLDLLEHCQHQHIASSGHECLALREIVDGCTDWDPATTRWFDTVVHQDVEHVEDLRLPGITSRMETVYLHEEPLDEWKIQAFFSGDKLTLEIVTVESWGEYAKGLLDELVDTMRQLVQQPHEKLF